LAIQSSWQVGAVLFTACMGGKTIGAIAQIGYLVLGLSGFGVFWEGGGFDYVRSPSFGYLLGFVPGAWICGHQVYRRAPTLEHLAFGCGCGWVTIHLCGAAYVVLSHLTRWGEVGPLLERYSLNIAPGQLLMICAVTVLAWLLRKVLMY
jgi:biotin transport system substrate-specific component